MLSNNLRNHFSAHLRQPLLPPLMQIGQRVLVEPQLMQDGRVHVPEMIWVHCRAQSDIIRRADYLAAFDPAARHPHAESTVVMVASLPALRLWRPAQLAAP